MGGPEEVFGTSLGVGGGSKGPEQGFRHETPTDVKRCAACPRGVGVELGDIRGQGGGSLVRGVELLDLSWVCGT